MTVVLIGRGIVGRRLERLLSVHQPVFHDSRDATDRLSVGDGDVVVLAHPSHEASEVAALAATGCSVVTVGGELDDVHDLLVLDDAFEDGGGTLVVGAGFSPGLSGLLARHLASTLDTVDEIHLAVHGTAGPACAREHHHALRHWSPGWHDGQWREYVPGSGRELCWFPEPVGAMDCYRARLADPLLVHRAFPSVTRISGRRSANRRDRLTARLPMLRPPHSEGGVGALRVEIRGSAADGSRCCVVAGVAEMVGSAAAATAAAFVELMVDGSTDAGVVTPCDDDVPVVRLLDRIRSYGIRLQEFSGVPQLG